MKPDTAQLQIGETRTRKVAIIGSASNSYGHAPWADPTWEMWGLAWRCLDHPRFDRVFEVHNPEDWEISVDPAVYGPWVRDAKDSRGEPVEVVMLPHIAQEWGATAYPVEQAEALMGGRSYFTSSFSYMLALAIIEGATEIGIWGVDLVTDEEYTRQRPCAEFLLGIAHARGIRITIAEQSALLRNGYVYGLQTADSVMDPLEAKYAAKITEYRTRLRTREDECATLKGAIHECERFVEALQARRRGWRP